MIERAHADAFAQLSVEERRSIAESLRAANDDPAQAFHFSGLTGGEQETDPQRLAAMFARAQQQQPDLLGSILGKGGGAGNPLMQMVLSTVATLVMQRLLGGAAGQNTGQFGGGGGLGAILGQILGGAVGGGGAGGLGSSTGQQGTQDGGMTSLDDLLRQRTGQGETTAQPTGSGGGLEDLLGQLGAGGGRGGLGAILGQLAAGMQGAGQARLADTEQGDPQDSPRRF